MATFHQADFIGPGIGRLREFVTAFSAALEASRSESEIVRHGSTLLKKLIDADDWLPARYAEPDPKGYRQYLLHADSQERFSVVSFVWGPGQASPIHDHTVWGIIGVLRGAEVTQNFLRQPDGRLIEQDPPVRLERGAVTAVSPVIGDYHRVSNALADKPSISIHVYGANIGAVRRSIYEADGSSKSFISGYSNIDLPNLWDRSKELSGL